MEEKKHARDLVGTMHAIEKKLDYTTTFEERRL